MIWFKTSGFVSARKRIFLNSTCNRFLSFQTYENGLAMKMFHRIVGHGRRLLQLIRDKKVETQVTRSVKGDINANVRDKGLLNANPLPYEQKFRTNYFINHILRWTTNGTAAQIRRNAAKKIIYGGRNAVPYLGFVGINLISGHGLVTKEDEIERVCEDIRICLKKDENPENTVSVSSVNDLEIGEVIAKGCNAVVHAGRWKKETPDAKSEESLPDVQPEFHPNSNILARFHTFNLAVKLMFNYDAESNAHAILKAMHRETVPTDCIIGKIGFSNFSPSIKNSLPPHPNVVKMHCAFADVMPLLPDAIKIYPDALPYRLNKEGSGRNMTLFLVMKRYHCSLREYLEHCNPSSTTRVALFTQLLEAILHLTRNGVAHRDLKTDNILLDLTLGTEMPALAITDFGNCYIDKHLKLPYTSIDVERGGNWALMAPEIKTAVPGPFCILDYNKSDLWTAATLAYEIFGETNPFYASANDSWLEENLPEIPKLQNPLKLLLSDMLKQDPNQRPSVAVAANVCHLVLWGPLTLLTANAKQFSEEKVVEWLAMEAASSILQGNSENTYLLCLLRNMFLSRVRMKEVRSAIEYFC